MATAGHGLPETGDSHRSWQTLGTDIASSQADTGAAGQASFRVSKGLSSKLLSQSLKQARVDTVTCYVALVEDLPLKFPA